MITMCTGGKDDTKKLLDKCIAEFRDTVRGAKDNRSLAMMNFADLATSTQNILHGLLPVGSWQDCLIEDHVGWNGHYFNFGPTNISRHRHLVFSFLVCSVLSTIITWQDDAFKAAAEDMGSEGSKSLNAIKGLWLSGSRENTVYAGVDAQSLPTLRLQVTGGKMLICCCARQASAYWNTESLPEIRSKLMSLQAKSIPDAISFESLSAAFIRTGDLVFMPAGYIVLEKCVHDNDIGIRQGLKQLRSGLVVVSVYRYHPDR